MQINPFRLGIVFGSLLAVFHTAWSVLVATGWAQMLLDFVFWVHFISPPYHVDAFDFARAAVLIGFTFIVGLMGGMVGGALWNKMARPG